MVGTASEMIKVRIKMNEDVNNNNHLSSAYHNESGIV